MLSYNQKPCSIASVFQYKKEAVLENIATLKGFRGKGLIGELIYYIQRDVEERNIDRMWVFPISEEVEKVYQKYGFETIGKRKMIHAFLEGEGVKEIQGG